MGANRRYTRDLSKPAYQPRHAWVRTSERAPVWPAIIVEWRKRDDMWEARVVVVSREGHVSDGWLSAEQIRPAD